MNIHQTAPSAAYVWEEVIKSQLNLNHSVSLRHQTHYQVVGDSI